MLLMYTSENSNDKIHMKINSNFFEKFSVYYTTIENLQTRETNNENE